MQADKSATLPAVDEVPRKARRIDCYVRSTVPSPLAETVDDIIERLHRLCDRGRFADVRVCVWPPEGHAASEPDDERERTRHDLVAEFERWAAEHDATLEPAFRREESPPFSHGLGPEEPRERLRVPVVALALRADSAESDAEPDPLRGVVPHTTAPGTDDERTHTVNEWLTSVERSERKPVAGSAQTDGRPSLGGQR